MAEPTTNLNDLDVPALEKILDEQADTAGRTYLKEVMAVRNRKIKEAELDHWGLTEEQYDRAMEQAHAPHRAERDLHAAQNQLARVQDKMKTTPPDELEGEYKQLKDQEADLAKQASDLQAVHDAAKKETPSKLVLLNQARRDANKAMRQAQQANVGGVAIRGHGVAAK